MFTLTLVSLSPSIEDSIVCERFLDFFDDFTVEFEIKTAEEALDLEDKIFELLSIMELSIESAHLLLTDSNTSKYRKIEHIEDLRYFIDESNALQTLIDPTIPGAGIFVDDPINPINAAPSGMHVDVDGIPTTQNMTYPASEYDKIGIDQDIEDKKRDDIVIKAHLTSLGASFPYLNESDLMEDFEKLSRMDEVTDADLINLLRMGMDGLGKAWEKGEALAGKIGAAIKDKSKQKEILKGAKIELSQAKELSDEHIQKARSMADRVEDDAPKLATKIREEIKKTSDRLRN